MQIKKTVIKLCTPLEGNFVPTQEAPNLAAFPYNLLSCFLPNPRTPLIILFLFLLPLFEALAGYHAPYLSALQPHYFYSRL